MNKLAISRSVCGAILSVACILLAGLLAGCAQENAAYQAATVPAEESSPLPEAVEPAEAVETAAQPPVADLPRLDDNVQPAAAVAPAGSDAVVAVSSCDGENSVAVAKDLSGKALADALMDQWLRDHPEADWVAEEREKHAFQPPADNSDLLVGEQGKSHAYGNYTEIDLLTWARETEKLVAEGSRIFHDADQLGSTLAVSCDMCHPHAANTHPETYPKFQAQLGRAVLLRDMINWCLENPVRGDKLAADSPAMRALEAYIMAQRKGVAMNYGKH